MAQTTDVSHGVLASCFIRWTVRAFQVYHNFFPTISVRGHNGHCFLFLRHLPKPYAGKTALPPLGDILFHCGPPHLPQHQIVSLFRIPMRS